MPSRARLAFIRFTRRVTSFTRFSRSRLGRLASLICDCGHRSHAAVLWFTAQPAEKSALKELGVESIGLCPSMFARYRNARWMDHIGFDLMGAQPARQPEAIAASLIGDGDPLDDVAGLIGFLPPTMQKLQQCILIGRELFQRLSFNSRHNTGDQPT